MADTAVTARITGRVQGVWFRGWTRETARALGLTGWVRNEADGSVTGFFAGPGTAVAQMTKALHSGPDSARVDTVVTRPADPGEAPADFTIRR